MFYLALYTAVMLFYYPTTEKHKVITWQEILLYLWQVTFVCEMYRTVSGRDLIEITHLAI
jgi:hypothetical protein